jgi:hypothetical protein
MNPLSLIWDLLPDASDNVQGWLAYTGVAAAPDAWTDAPDSMFGAPGSDKAAYEQAIYWLMLASRRADYEHLTVEQDRLYGIADHLNNTMESKSRLAVLSEAHEAIVTSGLPEADITIIGGILNANWWAIARRKGATLTVLGLVVGGTGYWVYRRST